MSVFTARTDKRHQHDLQQSVFFNRGTGLIMKQLGIPSAVGAILFALPSLRMLTIFF